MDFDEAYPGIYMNYNLYIHITHMYITHMYINLSCTYCKLLHVNLVIYFHNLDLKWKSKLNTWKDHKTWRFARPELEVTLLHWWRIYVYKALCGNPATTLLDVMVQITIIKMVSKMMKLTTEFEVWSWIFLARKLNWVDVSFLCASFW